MKAQLSLCCVSSDGNYCVGDAKKITKVMVGGRSRLRACLVCNQSLMRY